MRVLGELPCGCLERKHQGGDVEKLEDVLVEWFSEAGLQFDCTAME